MDDFSYRLGDTGVVLNPTTPTLPFCDITKIKGLDSAELRITERDHEGVDGGFLDAYFEKMRTLTLEGQVITNGVGTESYLDTLKSNWSPQRASIPLYFKHPEVDERLIMVKPLGVRYDVDELRRVGSTDVQFMCQAEDPRVYSSEEFSVDLVTSLVGSSGGAEFPMGFPMGFGAAVAPVTTNVYNGGNRPTTGIITLVGPLSNPIIYNDTTGEALAFTITLGATDFLVIDLYYRTVKLNGVSSRRGTMTRWEWFLFAPGDNTLRYQASGTPGPANVTYRYAWR